MNDWWEDWKKADGTPCTRWEVMRATVGMRRRNRDIMSMMQTLGPWAIERKVEHLCQELPGVTSPEDVAEITAGLMRRVMQ